MDKRGFAGFLLYHGPSVLDGEPIICVVPNPLQTRVNYKTSVLVQTYIFRADIGPLEAVATRADASICGDCRHRGTFDGERMRDRSCYVQLWGGPRNIWLAFAAGKYHVEPKPDEILDGLIVRLGSYGDPAAIPTEIWRRALSRSFATVGYTHQWRTCDQEFSRWCMASCDTAAERSEARERGWRTFRVRGAQEAIQVREVICPASIEAGKLTNCASCRACGGHRAKARADIVIMAHGDRGKVRAFERTIA